MQVEPDHIADFVDEQRVFRELPGLGPMRLQGKGFPHPGHRRLRQADPLGQRPCTPVRRIGRGGFQGVNQHVFNVGVGDAARRAWPWLIEQARHPVLDEALAPFADRRQGHVQRGRDRRVRLARRTPQDDPRPQRQRLRGGGAAGVALEGLTLARAQDERQDRSADVHWGVSLYTTYERRPIIVSRTSDSVH
jgi:hypothetical protein